MRKKRAPAAIADVVSLDLAWRYRWLQSFGLLNADVHAAIQREATRIERNLAGRPLEDRVIALEEFLEEHGWLEAAERHIRHLAAGRERWRTA